MDLDTLFDAAMAGDADATAKLEMEADTLFKDEETILHLESEKGNTERVRFILREFPHKNLLPKLSSYKHTALHLAIYGGHTEVAELLIDAARHLPPPSDGDDNSVTSFQAFLRQGDKDMDTALHAAVMEGNVSIVKLLVEADPTDTHIQNNKGKTPVYIAVEKGLNDVAEIISTTCTAPSFDGPHGSTVVRIKNLDQAKSPGGSLYKIMDKDALYAAAIARDADSIAALEMHADKLQENQETILHTESKNGKTEHVRFILREFADKNLLVKLNRYEQTALHLASSRGHTEVAEVLINAATHLLPPPPDDDNTDLDNPVSSFQAFLRQGDTGMDTALHYAVKLGNVDLVKLIVKADPSDSHTPNTKGQTPIYIAAKRGYYNIVKMICTTRTAPLDLDGPGGSTTVLHILINNADPEKEEDKEVIRQMIKAVINNYGVEKFKNFIQFLDRTDEKRCIILELAVERNFLDTAELILAQLDVETNLNTFGLMLAQSETSSRMSSSLMGIRPLIYKAMDKEYSDMFNLLTLTYDRYERAASLFTRLYAPAADVLKMPLFISAISGRQEVISIRYTNSELYDLDGLKEGPIPSMG